MLKFEVRQKASLLLERVWKIEINKRFLAIMTRSLNREPDWVYIYDRDGREILEVSFRKINDIASTENSILILPSNEDRLYIVDGPFDIRYFNVEKGYFFLRTDGRYVELCGSECVVYDLEGNKVGKGVLSNRLTRISLSIVGDRVIERCGSSMAISRGNVVVLFQRGKPLWKRHFAYGVSAIFFNDRCDKIAVFSEVNDLVYILNVEKGKLIGVIELEERGILEKLINYVKWKLGMYLHIPYSSVLWKEDRLAVTTWDRVLVFEA